MLFSSIPFLFYFLPAVLIVYFLVPNFLKNGVLLAFSLFFYGWGEPKYVVLMVGSILLFFLCGLAIGKAQSKKQGFMVAFPPRLSVGPFAEKVKRNLRGIGGRLRRLQNGRIRTCKRPCLCKSAS